MPTDDQRQRESWQANAAAWTATVRGGGIASRRLGTDAAILADLRARRPGRVLDLGCGEGWLCRALAAEGIAAVGVDAAPALVAEARAAGGRFEVMDYATLAGAPPSLGRFDAIACNFALLDEDIVPLLRGLRALLAPGGALCVQTVHPWRTAAGTAYRDGWRLETFDGFGDQPFPEAMPWYFRTLARWLDDLSAAGWRLEALRETPDPEGGLPLSLRLVAADPPLRSA